MQFTVLIEFLIPGLLTVLAFLLVVMGGELPDLKGSSSAGDTVSMLLLLAVSYPVGILVNFPIFKTLQKKLSWKAKKEILDRYQKEQNLDLVEVARHHFGLNFKARSQEDLSDLWDALRAAAFSSGIERLASNHSYHEGLQRLARGMLVPLLLLFGLVAWHVERPFSWLHLGLIVGLLSLSAWLLSHSLKTENGQIARFFLVIPDVAKLVKAGVGAVPRGKPHSMFPRIYQSPLDRPGGPHIRGLPIAASEVLRHLAAGKSVDDVKAEFPELETEDLSECLRFAAWLAAESAGSPVAGIPAG
jgi:uncharacterized protein (DUF433 family)